MARSGNDGGNLAVVFGIFVAIIISYLIVLLQNPWINDLLYRLQNWNG